MIVGIRLLGIAIYLVRVEFPIKVAHTIKQPGSSDDPGIAGI